MEWVKLNLNRTEDLIWLREKSEIEPLMVKALIDQHARPRCTLTDHGVLLIFRGVNLFKEEGNHELTSIRLWCTENRIVSAQNYSLNSVNVLFKLYESGKAPSEVDEFIMALLNELIAKVRDKVHTYDDYVDQLEIKMIDPKLGFSEREISQTRLILLELKRYILPMKDVLIEMSSLELFQDKSHHIHLKELSNEIQKCIDGLESMKEQLVVMQDESSKMLATKMNMQLYNLSKVSIVFLPIGFVTGLLGMNLNGIPYSDSPYAFLVVCVVLIAVGLAIAISFKKNWLN